MSTQTDLTPAALAGFNGDLDSCPYLFSSPNWYAFHAGYWARWFNKGEPRAVRLGRGDKVHISGEQVKVLAVRGSARPRVELVS